MCICIQKSIYIYILKNLNSIRILTMAQMGFPLNVPQRSPSQASYTSIRVCSHKVRILLWRCVAGDFSGSGWQIELNHQPMSTSLCVMWYMWNVCTLDHNIQVHRITHLLAKVKTINWVHAFIERNSLDYKVDSMILAQCFRMAAKSVVVSSKITCFTDLWLCTAPCVNEVTSDRDALDGHHWHHRMFRSKVESWLTNIKY